MTIWNDAYRQATWDGLSAEPWDILIVGGGITGAGILREAARLNFRTLLVEQRDFAWGTSSRSSKLVHGGLRYLKTGQVNLTRASVQGREQLLAEGAGLVDPLGFLLAQYENDGASAGRLVYGAGLTVYDLLALQWSHRYYSPQDFQMMAPYISPTGLRGGFHYQDAQTDDARLVPVSYTHLDVYKRQVEHPANLPGDFIGQLLEVRLHLAPAYALSLIHI